MENQRAEAGKYCDLVIAKARKEFGLDFEACHDWPYSVFSSAVIADNSRNLTLSFTLPEDSPSWSIIVASAELSIGITHNFQDDVESPREESDVFIHETVERIAIDCKYLLTDFHSESASRNPSVIKRFAISIDYEQETSPRRFDSIADGIAEVTSTTWLEAPFFDREKNSCIYFDTMVYEFVAANPISCPELVSGLRRVAIFNDIVVSDYNLLRPSKDLSKSGINRIGVIPRRS